MRSENITDMIENLRKEVIENIVLKHNPEKSYYSEWDSKNLKKEIRENLGVLIPADKWVQEDGIIEKEFISRLTELSDKYMAERAANFGIEVFRQAEKTLLLQVLDQGWKDHLLMLDQMRQSIGLRAYAQKDPLNEYKRESFELIEEMLDKLRKTITSVLSYIEIKQEKTIEKEHYNDPVEIPIKKIPRNAKCPLCDSGKKYKHCCGKY